MSNKNELLEKNKDIEEIKENAQVVDETIENNNEITNVAEKENNENTQIICDANKNNNKIKNANTKETNENLNNTDELEENVTNVETKENEATVASSQELTEDEVNVSETKAEKIEENKKFTFVQIPKKSNDILSVFILLVVLFFTVILLVFTGFTIYNVFNPNIISGVSIKGIDVSGLSPSDAKYQLDNYLSDKLPEEIKVKHGDFETTISLAQMGIRFDTKTATNSAFSIARKGNAFENNLVVLQTMFDKVNLEPNIMFDKELLTKNLEDISTQLPDTVVQNSYYIEGNDLIITSGKEGNVVDVDSTIQSIANSISNFSALNTPIELSIKTKQPDKIDVEKIYNEVKKDPVDAYYTKDPFAVHPSENGVDFNISLDDAKNMISSEVKEEYIVPLKYIAPNVTTNMIGTEAFPDMLSTFSTRYAASNRNRTTNLILAANKINGTVLMPGETFSYNKVVGARTIAAGYKEAPIYVEGRVEDGLRWWYLPNYFYFV